MNPSPREEAKVGSAYKHDKMLMATKRRENAFNSTYLSTAFNDIQRTDDCVCNTTGEDSSYHALSIVGHVMHVTHFSALSDKKNSSKEFVKSFNKI